MKETRRVKERQRKIIIYIDIQIGRGMLRGRRQTKRQKRTKKEREIYNINIQASRQLKRKGKSTKRGAKNKDKEQDKYIKGDKETQRGQCETTPHKEDNERQEDTKRDNNKDKERQREAKSSKERRIATTIYKK